MKRIAIFTIIFLIVAFAGFSFWAISLGFTKVKPTAISISDKLASNVISKFVRIPEGIQRPAYDYYETGYFWEMETLEKEVTGIKLKYTPSYSAQETDIVVNLEMPEGGDPSIFMKVLPAVIADQNLLMAAQNPLKPELKSFNNELISELEIRTDTKNNQTIAIGWVMKKDKLSQDIKEDYKKLDYSPWILKTLYDIPSMVIDIFRS